MYKSVHVTFVFWVQKKTPPTPYMSGTFVLAPPTALDIACEVNLLGQAGGKFVQTNYLGLRTKVTTLNFFNTSL